MTIVAQEPGPPTGTGTDPKAIADRAAAEAVRSGRRVALTAMDDADRALVRDRLRWRHDLVTRTEGEGAARHLVVIPI